MAATRLPEVDVVVLGVGLVGSIMARELARAGLKVVGLERGEPRDTVPDFQGPAMHDELRYSVRKALMQDNTRETVTFRNRGSEVGAAAAALGELPPGHRRGRRAGALERPDLPLPGHRLPDADPHRAALRREDPRAGPAGAGLGRDRGRTGAAFRPLRVPAGDLRQGRQPEGNEGRRRQPVRGPALARVPEPAAEGALWLRHVPQGRGQPRLPPVPAAVRQHEPALYQPGGAAHEHLHVLRLLRALRLRALRQVLAADLHPAGADEGPELHPAHPVPGAAHQPRCGEEDGDRRHLHRRRGARVRAARPAGDRRHVCAEQRAHAAAVRHRHALRPGHRARRGGPQLRLPDDERGAGVLRPRRQHQPVHALRLQRHADRRLRQRQLRPRAAGIRRRRLRRRGDEPWPADRIPSDAAGHAGLGFGLEARRGRRTTTTPR